MSVAHVVKVAFVAAVSLVLFTAGSSFGALARAGEGTRTAALIVRVLAYDGAIDSRAGDTVTIGVLFAASDAGSRACKDRLVEALSGLPADQRVAGRPVAARGVALDPRQGPGAALDGVAWAALYLCPGLEGAAKALSEYSRRRSILTFTGTEGLAGISVALLETDGKSRMVIDAAAASAEGARLAPTLLRLAEVSGAEAGADPDEPVRLKASMTPPKPVPASMVPPEYPADLRAARVTGRVVLLVEVRKDGTVGRVQSRSGHPQLAEAASSAVRRWRFEPARQDGKPLAVWLPYPFDFELD